MIGGFKEYREFEFYRIYALKVDRLNLIMDSSADCDFGVKVGYFRNDECFEYFPNRFNSKIINNNEIRFFGNTKIFCNPHTDRDENNLSPIKVENSIIIYKYYKGKWVLQNESNFTCW